MPSEELDAFLEVLPRALVVTEGVRNAAQITEKKALQPV
jgi:hypothetical protein